MWQRMSSGLRRDVCWKIGRHFGEARRRASSWCFVGGRSEGRLDVARSPDWSLLFAGRNMAHRNARSDSALRLRLGVIGGRPWPAQQPDVGPKRGAQGSDSVDIHLFGSDLRRGTGSRSPDPIRGLASGPRTSALWRKSGLAKTGGRSTPGFERPLLGPNLADRALGRPWTAPYHRHAIETQLSYLGQARTCGCTAAFASSRADILPPSFPLYLNVARSGTFSRTGVVIRGSIVNGGNVGIRIGLYCTVLTRIDGAERTCVARVGLRARLHTGALRHGR